MPRNEEGEFELILGNRQLLSFFFLLVVLLGVFFTMGYIVGRNSGPVTNEIVGAPNTGGSSSARVVVEPSNNGPSAMPRETPVRQADARDAQPESKPEASKAEPAKPEPVKQDPVKAEAPKPEPAKPAPAKVEAAKPEPSKPQPVSEPAKGQPYWQVVAVAKADADRVAGALKSRQLPAAVVPGPDAAIFRVVVGPLPNDAAVQSVRAKLEEAGFKPILKRF